MAEKASGSVIETRVYTVSGVDTRLAGKQATLVSGANIKTINKSSILGAGDISLATADQVAAKQDKLVSGQNLKTVGGVSLLGSGDIPNPTVTVDGALSDTSQNPVQNKVLKAALDEKQNAGQYLYADESGLSLTIGMNIDDYASQLAAAFEEEINNLNVASDKGRVARQFGFYNNNMGPYGESSYAMPGIGVYPVANIDDGGFNAIVVSGILVDGSNNVAEFSTKLGGPTSNGTDAIPEDELGMATIYISKGGMYLVFIARASN